MKKITALLITLFLSFYSYSQVQSKLKISKLLDRFYIYTTYGDPGDGSTYPSNGMYVITPKGVVLIDTPWDTTQFQPLLDSIYLRHHQKVAFCISTHFHSDRTAGLDYFRTQGIKTYSSKQTYDLCNERHEKLAQYYFTSDTVFKLCNKQLETYYPGPGHAPDNIVIWFKDAQVLYGGCFVKSTETNSPGNLGDANLNEWKISLNKVVKKYPSANYVIPGHLGWDQNGLLHTLEIVENAIKK
ncbi:MAG: subclass B1 metallo-beta-lactamase [Saprospiraceae bacterium]